MVCHECGIDPESDSNYQEVACFVSGMQAKVKPPFRGNGGFVFGPRPPERTTTVDDAQRRELLKQIDEITKQIWERHHEETRQQIDELYKELYRRIKELRDDAGGN